MSEFILPSANDFEESDDSPFTSPVLDELVPADVGGHPTEVPQHVKDMSNYEKWAVGTGADMMSTKRALENPLLNAELLTKSVLSSAIGDNAVGRFIGGRNEKIREKLKYNEEQRSRDEDQFRFLKQDPYFKGGEFTSSAALGALLPFLKGNSIATTALKNFLPNALFEAATTEGGAGDRLAAGVKGGAGASAGTAVLGAAGKLGRVVAPRVAKKLSPVFKNARTQWQNVEDRVKQELADKFGAPLSLGDITPGPMNLIRKAENWFPGTFNRENVLKAQGDALLAKLHPKDTLLDGMKATSRALAKRGEEIYEPVMNKIGKSSLLIPADNMHSALKETYRKYPGLFTEVKLDADDQKLLMEFIDQDIPDALTFTEFTKLKHAIGSAQGQAERAVNTMNNPYPAQALTNMKKAYSAAMDDIKSWGSTAKSKSTKAKYAEIVKEYQNATKLWEQEVLPFKKNSFTADVMSKNQTPEQQIAALLKKSVVRDNVVLPQVRQHAPEAADLFDAVKLMNRGAKSAITEADEHGSHILDTLMAIGHPGVVGAQNALSKGSSSPLLKDLYLGTFDDLMPAATKGRWSSGPGNVGGALSQLLSTVPVSYGRENGETAMGLGALPLLWYKQLADEEDQSIGSASSTRGQGGVQ